MMARWRAVAAAVLVAAACREGAPPEPPRPVIETDGPNLLTLTRGAVVVHRTGEATLELSAIQAIDSDPSTFWATPPGDLDETLTVALGGEAEIRRIGISSGTLGPRNLARTVRFDASSDGASFAPLGTVTLEAKGDAWRDVPPVRACFLRVTTVPDEQTSAAFFRVPALLAAGSLRPAPPVPIDGTWRINDFEARFETRDGLVRGITSETPPRLIEGGWDGTVLRLAWSRANEHGVAAVVVAPDGRRLNGVVWYLWAHRPFRGTTWFGARDAAGATPPPSGSPRAVFLRSDGRYPLYGLSFAGEALRPHSRGAVLELASMIERAGERRLRLVAHHVGTGTAESDRRLAAARLARLREALRDAGADLARVEIAAAGRDAALAANDRPWSPLQVVLNNRIDLELVQPERR